MNRLNSQTSMSTEPLRSRTLANAPPTSFRLAIEADQWEFAKDCSRAGQVEIAGADGDRTHDLLTARAREADGWRMHAAFWHACDLKK